MKRLPLAVLLATLLAVGGSAFAQSDDDEERKAPPVPSAMDANLFYQLLLGELSARTGDPAAGFQEIFDAARRTNDPELYRRAFEIAWESRDADRAFEAVRAWRRAYPKARDATRLQLQLAVALNRLTEAIEPLKTDIALADPKDRETALLVVPRFFARVGDKKAAAQIVEQALADYLSQPATGPAAWTAVGQMRLAADDSAGAVDAAQRGSAMNPQADGPALLAVQLMENRAAQAEPIVLRYLQGKPRFELRMDYARALLDAQRYAEAATQLRAVTAEKPDLPDAWRALGYLQLQDNQDAAAEASYKRYLELAQQQRPSEERNAGIAQAYLSLSRIAEKRKDFALANAWLDKVENPQDLIAAQQRRASILARQGKLEEGRKLIRSVPEREPGDAKLKVQAEVQLLRDNKQYKAAFDLMSQLTAEPPLDPDLVYEQAMLAEKMNNLAEMEKLLRSIIAAKPEYHHAYNALGYSFAERNIRLPEAKELIEKALSFAPGDPYISDSLAWVEFRMGNKSEALRILSTAYKARPDAEIAAHLGEVLWSMGDRAKAQAIWKEGLLLNSDNDTLLETLKRLHVKP